MNDSNKFHKPQLLRMKFHTGYVRFVPAAYNNGNKALQMIDAKTGEPICRPSINLGHEVGSNEMAIKTHDENEGVWDYLASIGFIEPAHVRLERSGFVQFPIARLTPDAMEFYDNMKSAELKREFVQQDLTQALTENLTEAADMVARVVAVAEHLGKEDPVARRRAGLKALRAFFALYRLQLRIVRPELEARRKVAEATAQAVAGMKGAPK